MITNNCKFIIKQEVIMKYLVNEDCIGCGLCASTCPEVFEIKDDGFARAEDIDTDSEEAKVAMESCPVNAIEEA